MKKINVQGFSTVSTVFTIIFLAMLVVASFYFYKYPKKVVPQIAPSETKESTSETSSDKAPNSSLIPKSTSSKTSSTQTLKIQMVIVRQFGGSTMLIQECSTKSYLTEKADYIIEGVVESSESKWNEQKTSIYTYINIIIQKYLKGTPFEENKLQIITQGGEVDGIGQGVSNQPVFNQGKKVRIYFEKSNGEFSIVCARAGVEEI